MKILVLVHNFPNHGSWFRALEIANRMAQSGHAVTLMCTSNRKLYRPERTTNEHGVELVECGNWTLFNAKQEGWSVFDIATRLKRVLKTRPDFVYAMSHKPCCLLPGMLAKLFGARLAIDWVDWWGGREGLYQSSVIPSFAFQSMAMPIRFARQVCFGFENFWEARCLHLADKVTLISDEYYTHPAVPRNLREKTMVLTSGSDLQTIQPIPHAQARREIGEVLRGVPGDALILGYIANHNPDEKLMLEAFAKVCDERDDVWLLAGGAGFENTPPCVQQRIRHRVRHAGYVPFEKVGTLLAAANLLLLPLDSRKLNRARYPHKLSDYVAAGRPIAACDVGVAGELVKRHNIGFVSAPNADDFARTILAALAAPQQLTAIGEHTRTTAQTTWNWDTLTAELFEFLEL